MNALQVIINILLVTAPIPLLIFIAEYAKTRWRESALGRILMYQKVSFLAYLTLVITGFFFGDYPGKDWIRLLVYVSIVFTFWSMVFLLYKARKQVRKEENEKCEKELKKKAEDELRKD